MKLAPLDSPGHSHSGVPPAVVWVLALLLLAVLVWPLYHGADLRKRAAQQRLKQNWNQEHRLLPLLGLAHAQSLESGESLPREDRDRLWRELENYRGSHPAPLWLELAWLEARAGDMDKARLALARAKQADPGQYALWTRARMWDPWRASLGLTKP